MSLLDGLNEQQREAAATTEGPVLILAGAGSGKTRTIIHRIAYIIESKKAWPSQILAITFTNKAAGEMRERIAAMNVEESDRIWMYTFHAMCARIMRIHSQWLGYSDNFVIYDTDDQKRLYKTLIKELDFNDKMFPFQYVSSQISTAKNNFWTPEDYLKNNPGEFRAEKVAQYYRLYQDTLKKNNAMDFDDLIYNTLVLFKGFPEILEQYQNRFKYILVDEYQDTNHSQYELVNLLAAGHRNLCVCGDDDQSIYMWRGADINNILDFEKDYPDAKVVKLEENYRSTSVILDCANKVIANNTGRKDKNLWTRNPGDDKIVVSSFNQGYDEARFVAQEIENLRADKGLEELSLCQQAGGDGYLLPTICGRAIFENVLDGNFKTSNPFIETPYDKCWEPVYVMNKIMLGLYQVYMRCDLLQAKEILVKMADWFGYSVIDKLSHDDLQKLLVCEHGSINESFIDVYQITGEERQSHSCPLLHHT